MDPITSFTGRYRFLSNFYPAAVVLDGVLYQSVEHAYQAAKTLDHKERKKFQVPLLPPADAKKMGRGVTLRPDWESVKLNIMLVLLRDKFYGTNPGHLTEQLLDTGDAELIEGNWWGDIFWGVCNGIGENHLGKLLMQVREEISRL